MTLSARAKRGLAALGLVASVVFFVLAGLAASNAFAQQFSPSCSDLLVQGVPAHLRWDYMLIASYTVTFLAWFSLRSSSGPKRKILFALPLVLAVVDVTENRLIATARNACPDIGSWGGAVTVAALVKWLLFIAAVGVSLWLWRSPPDPT